MLRVGKGEELRRMCRWPFTRDFESESGRYSLFSYGEGGGIGASKVPEDGREPR
jgi:hypothetical protein